MLTREQAIDRLEEIAAKVQRIVHDSEQLEAERAELLKERREVRKIALAQLIPPQKVNPNPLNKQRIYNARQGVSQEAVLRAFRDSDKNELSPREISEAAHITIHSAYAAVAALAKHGLLKKNRDGVLTTYEMAVHADNHAH